MALDWVGALGTAVVGLAGISATYWAAAKARIAQGDTCSWLLVRRMTVCASQISVTFTLGT